MAKWAIRAVVGAGIGAVVGVILTSTAGERSRNEGQDVPSGTWIVGGAGIGAGIGGLTCGGYLTLRAPGGSAIIRVPLPSQPGPQCVLA